jgi:hypothetical protein
MATGRPPAGQAELEKSHIGSLISELKNLFNQGLGTETVHYRLVDQFESAAPCRYLFVGGSHVAKEGNVMADRHDMIVCSASQWRPNKMAEEEMSAKVDEALNYRLVMS